MSASPFKKGLPWLAAGLLLFLVSMIVFLYDLSRTDQDILSELESSLQIELDKSIWYYSSLDSISSTTNQPHSPVCKLVFGPTQTLQSWSQNQYLPLQKHIDRLRNVSENKLLQLDERYYYQIRTYYPDSTVTYLIPLMSSYEVDNNFLEPYLFLGKWKQLFSTSQIKSFRCSAGPMSDGIEAEIQLFGPEDEVLLSMTNIPVAPLRVRNRIAVLLLLGLSLLAFVVFLRIYALRRRRYRYQINFGLFMGVLFLRLLMYLTNFPVKYLDIPLFRPDILAFSDWAPSLGEMTINILTFSTLIWILYTHFFRLSNLAYRKLMQRPTLAWPFLVVTIFISSYSVKIFVDVFEQIIANSQVDIEFSNIFKIDFSSFLILLDVGLLLLAISMVIMTLLKFNLLLGRRLNWSLPFLAINIGPLLIFNLFLHPSAVFLAILVCLLIVGLCIVVFRIPFRPILHHDLANYLIITGCFSLLVTYNIIVGINFKNQQKAQRIADRVLGSRSAATVSAYTKSMKNLEREQRQIREKSREFQDINDFRDWLKEQFFRNNFKEFDPFLYIYDNDNNRLDENVIRDPKFGPEQDIPLEMRGSSVSDDYLLLQFPNSENQYNDLYVGAFDLFLGNDSSNFLRLLLELIPTSQETEGLYPSLSLDQQVYDEIKLINSFDHAIYRDGLLHNDWGKSAFPVYMEGYEQIEGKTNQVRGKYHEYLEPVGDDRLVVVRYPKQTFFNMMTTFSFIFYFFSLGTLILLGIPIMGLRSLRSQQFVYDIPLRSKIRFGLLAISVLPMLVIIVLLYPFVSSRYAQDARDELSEETGRITNIIQPEFRTLRNDPFSRLSLQKDFRGRILTLESYLRNDINVYDADGKFVVSTQPMIFELGISTDLMDAKALKILQEERISDLVIKEKMGKLEYLSSYRPIIGSSKNPIGFINVPYIAKQDQLEDQVINFLAYLANIYLLAFLLLNLIAVFVSNAITKPLTVVQQRLSDTSLGNINEPILYNSKDEIGAIVKAYNQMVEKLAESEKKLTQNERELAWRQMARQVAHEIKNPLTPMKLSIQHLSRAWNEQTPRLEKMFPKVMKTLMVQIDSLVRIANSFSEFAKMPEPVKTRVNVNDVLLEVVDLYTQSEEAIWLIDVPKEEFWAYGDRDQLSRCFNNIIKNGLQAMEENGILHISMRIMIDRTRIEIKDNGKGMPEEVQKRIFEPSFSTKTSGMGLGLAIVKRIIENTGGQISFRSRENEGTTFIIEIPTLEEVELAKLP